MMNSIGINKPKKDTKIVVAMSGGVDSSVVAALMKAEGYNPILFETESLGGRQTLASQGIIHGGVIGPYLTHAAFAKACSHGARIPMRRA